MLNKNCIQHGSTWLLRDCWKMLKADYGFTSN